VTHKVSIHAGFKSFLAECTPKSTPPPLEIWTPARRFQTWSHCAGSNRGLESLAGSLILRSNSSQV